MEEENIYLKEYRLTEKYEDFSGQQEIKKENTKQEGTQLKKAKRKLFPLSQCKKIYEIKFIKKKNFLSVCICVSREKH